MESQQKIFISYSHKDKMWFEKLQTCFKVYIKKYALVIWEDTQIKTGDLWKDEIKQALEAATVAVLLVSRDFLASDFITQQELPPLLEAAEKTGLKIAWVNLRPSSVEATYPEITKYQSVSTDMKALSSFRGHKLDQEVEDIVKKIVALAQRT